MKRFLSLVLCLLLLVSFAACRQPGTPPPETTPSDTPDPDTVFRITVISGTTGMGFAKLMQDTADKTAAFSYQFDVVPAADMASSALISGSADLAAVPTNLAAVLYQKLAGDVQVVAVNTLGVLYLTENGDTVHGMADLRGKTVYCANQGANPDYITRYLLAQNGYTVGEDVFLDFSYNTPDELATALAAGLVDLAVLPEPKVTAALASNEALRIAVSFTEEWERVTDGAPLPQGCLLARRSFVESHPAELAVFLSEYRDSAIYVNEHPGEAAELIASYGILPKAPLALRAIPNCHICFLDGEAMQTALDTFFRVLYDANPASVGGQLPDKGLYYDESQM